MHVKSKTEKINPRINLTWAGCWKPGYVEQGRYLYDHELVVFTAGKSQVVVGDESFSCTTGDVIIIPPGVRHWTRALEEKVERHCFHFDWVQDMPSSRPSFVYEASGDYKRSSCKRAPKWLSVRLPLYSAGMPLKNLLPLLHHLEESDSSPEGSLRRRGLFLQLLAEILAAGKAKVRPVCGGKSLRLVQMMKQRIENDFRSPLSMGALAGEFKVTPVHMARAFRVIVGISPLEYLHRLRLEEAYRLLSAGSMNVAEVAGSVGFEDANYFSRLFRKKMGMLPSEVFSKRV